MGIDYETEEDGGVVAQGDMPRAMTNWPER